MPINEEALGPAIERAGYKYVDGSGYGATALWIPGTWNGDKFTPDTDSKSGMPAAPQSQEQIANALFPSSSPYLKANNPAQTQQIAPDRTAQIGIDSQGNRRYFTIDRNGFTVWGADAPPDNSQASTGLGYANLAENRRQFDITQQRQQALLEQQIRQTDAQIAAKEKELALQQANFEYLKTKDAYAQQMGDKRLALDTQAQMFNQQHAIAGLNLQKAQMQAQRDAMVFQAQVDADKFNAQMGFTVEQANQQAKAQKEAQLQSLASSISEAARDPGDRGKLASLLLANSGWGQENTAIGQGANLITDESKAPLESLLRTRQDVQRRPDNPYVFTPIKVQSIPGLNLDAINPQAIVGAPAQQPGAGVGGAPVAQPATGGGFDQAANNFAITQAAQSMGIPTNADKGGNPRGWRIVGERGIELEAPDGTIINQQQAKALGIDLKKLSAMPPGEGPDNYDDGIFGGFGNVQDDDRTLSTSFLRDALAKARAGTPFNAGNLPAPVYASSPGFSPYVTRLLGSLSAMGQGVPADLYADLAARYRPTGVNESVIRRSA